MPDAYVLPLVAVFAILAIVFLVLWRRAAGGAAAMSRMLEEQRAAHDRALHDAAVETARRTEAFVAAETQARTLSAGAEALQAEVAEARRTSQAATLRAGQAETRLEEIALRLAERTAERDELRNRHAESAGEAQRLGRELGEARLAARKEAEAAQQQIDTLRELREEMTQRFRLMAEESLQSTGTRMQASHTEQLGALLTPLREQVERFQTELASRETVAGQERARLGQQIDMLHARSEAIGQEAVNLTRALRGEKQKQGAWGEMILDQTLEASGLEEGVHFVKQDTRHDDDGRRLRPDVVVNLPGGRRVVIDSKVSLVDYEAACSAEDEAARSAAMGRHVKALRTHVGALSAKDYAGLDAASIDFVLLFVPVESAFAEAMRHDRDLGRYAQDRRVVMVTPTNLVAMLRTIEHVWAVERRQKNAEAIAHRAGLLYDKLHGFVESMSKVGAALDRAQAEHRNALGQLSTGGGNLIGQVEKLKRLGARTQKTIAGADEALMASESDAAPLPLTAEG